ncbi:MAG: TolC family protein [Chitinophagaceae bacterium]|nr:MAG: TolC family protein [Chitinophagaceae bacterium]
MKNILLLFFFLCGLKTAGQDRSADTLSETGFFAIVQAYHPVVRQADIAISTARAEVQLARGMFDPSIGVNTARKNFDGIRYYNETAPVLSIPTWYGIELQAGTNYLDGSRTDPTETPGKTNHLGVSVPLAKNLLMDKRRAALQTSRILRSLSTVEKKRIINDLLLEAGEAYWNWVRSYELVRVARSAIAINEKRLQFVIGSYQLGERAAIDSVEALTQLQGFRYQLNEATLQYENAKVQLNAWLWNEADVPYEIAESVSPSSGQLAALMERPLYGPSDNRLDSAIDQHPKLREFDYKLRALQINKRLKFQELLPMVNLKYNQLSKGYDLGKTAGDFFSVPNYRVGLQFSIPLRLSQGRAEYRMAKLKLEETTLMKAYSRQLLRTKLQMVYNEWENIQSQLRLQEALYQNLFRLQQAEEAKFFNGESSLFFINSREMKVVEARQKIIDIQAKLQVSALKVRHAAGLL